MIDHSKAIEALTKWAQDQQSNSVEATTRGLYRYLEMDGKPDPNLNHRLVINPDGFVYECYSGRFADIETQRDAL